MMNFMFERRNKMYNLRDFQRVCEEKKSNRKNGFWNFNLQISAITVNFARKFKANWLIV